MRFDRRPLLIRVACKLHNLCVDRMGINASISTVRGDVRSGDIASVLYTDGTGMYPGRRSDLDQSDTRNYLVERLKNLGKTRPSHSIYIEFNCYGN